MKIRHLPVLAVVLGAATATWAATPEKPAPTKPAANAEQVRDWSRIDTNRDGLVSPEEMEKWLAQNPGPLRK